MVHKHPGFQWSNPNGAENSQSFQKPQVQGPPGYQNQNHGQSNFRPYQQIAPYQQRPQQTHPSLDDLLYKYIKVTDEKMESQNSALTNLEIQLSQLATLVSEKIQGPIPSNTEKNPKEHLKAITLRSGKELDEPNNVKQEKYQSEQQVNKGKNDETPSEPLEDKEVKKKEEKNIEKMIALPVTIPFPQQLKREKLDGEFAKKLDLGEMKDIGVSLQFADQGTKKPKGIIENVLVRVDKFVFPVDFIVLEMKECPDEPIILGRPFLATGRAIIDVHQGQLILRADEERVIFDMQKILRFSGDESSNSCFSIDMISDLAHEFRDDQLTPDSMERCLANQAPYKTMIPSSEEKLKYWKKILRIRRCNQKKFNQKLNSKLSHLI
ncbi:hypothetical protein A4A49_13529 [Nicotiana attenuata]|uniref:Uncharacterized protein n=1 Tax=Nicotiana attenuata TaxID=49451 RepID=A0A314L6J8_NICAT|nr:hypothetical protein A4A49_13529 [Nicotiana attenuata]